LKANNGHVIVAADVIRLLEAFDPARDGDANKSKELTLALLEWSPKPFSRDIFNPGHVTATGVVLSPKRRRVLLVHHNRLDRWLLPGGHCESQDSRISDTAKREVIEETGVELADLAPVLVGVDVHPIPGNAKEPLHLHHDLIFAFQAESRECSCSVESREVAWCKLDEFDFYQLPWSIRNSVKRAVALQKWS
jgi:8-oxo-dGTP pyrophosphatase MutT (NUDIX family)